MNQPFRRLDGGRINRQIELKFSFDGTDYTGHPGDTLASALLANGVHKVASSIKYGRPRGIFSAGAEEPTGLIQVEFPFPEPMLTATTVELFDGLVARGLPSMGRLADRPDPARYDAVHAHCDVLVVGAGPAGLVAALTAARAGARVVLVDENPEAGGSLLGDTERLGGASAQDWAAAAVAELADYPKARVLQRTTAFGYYDDGFVLALERRTDHLGEQAPEHKARQRIWRIRRRNHSSKARNCLGVTAKRKYPIQPRMYWFNRMMRYDMDTLHRRDVSSRIRALARCHAFGTTRILTPAAVK